MNEDFDHETILILALDVKDAETTRRALGLRSNQCRRVFLGGPVEPQVVGKRACRYLVTSSANTSAATFVSALRVLNAATTYLDQLGFVNVTRLLIPQGGAHDTF